MVRRKREEFNLWPSFVDLFASVILILLFFMLILIVIIVSKDGVKNVELVTKPGLSSLEVDKEKLDPVLIKDDYLLIKYKDNVVSIDDETKKDLDKFLSRSKRRFPKHELMVFASDPTSKISKTIAKQQSLVRSLNIIKDIENKGYQSEDIKLNLLNYPKNFSNNIHGYILIKVVTKKGDKK